MSFFKPSAREKELGEWGQIGGFWAAFEAFGKTPFFHGKNGWYDSVFFLHQRFLSLGTPGRGGGSLYVVVGSWWGRGGKRTD